ncbi:sensor histidine kinase [Phenylobacterium sp.]|jgi:two-component sensor histidine kinase|uniref:sensor histidine kinase n=1 Tax=Phenylobacterium sp. TaxID=1871053 RepID=UPI002F419417
MTDDLATSNAPTASEVRHRMANTLQLLAALARMRSQRSTDPDARRQLLWMADAVGSLGALEQKRKPDGVDFTAFLVDMAPIWRRRQGSRPAELVVEAEPLWVQDHAASTLGLIAQELVGNALAHGFADGRSGKVTVQLRRRPDGRCDLRVADDGVGFDPAAGRERFGLWLVRSLSAQVQGEFSLVSQPGVSATLTFPV